MTSQSNDPQPAAPAIDLDLLKILVCPLTRSALKLEGDQLVSTVGGLRYPICDGVPVLLIDEAQLPDGVSSLEVFKEKYKDQIPDLDQV